MTSSLQRPPAALKTPPPTGQHCLILGLAREGASLARFLADLGNDVTITDSAPANTLQDRIDSIRGANANFVFGGDHAELVQRADILYVSPGVPESNPVFQAAVAHGVPIRSMTTLFFQLCPGKIIGITGSSGKSTTTALVGHILHEAGVDVVVGGNIGDPMIDLLPSISEETTVVLELSSFQLSILEQSPHIAVVTNISPNHLDRHGTMREYVAAKKHIVRHQSSDDYAILNAADPWSHEFARSTPAHVRWFGLDEDSEDGSCVRSGTLGLMESGTFTPVIDVDDIPLLGSHNVDNVLAACSAVAIAEVTPAAMAEAIRSFRPPPHRLQTVAVRNGVRYVDDSIATTPDRASVALRALLEPILLIAGGRDKHLPWDDFARLVVDRTSGLFLIGEATQLIENAVGEAMRSAPGKLTSHGVRCCSSLEEAVGCATDVAGPGDVVLLSPACTSYDMFRDFTERGERFAEAVEELNGA